MVYAFSCILHANSSSSLRKDLFSSGELQLLRGEIKHLKALKGHPNIVEIIEIVESPKNVYLVLELLNGGELFSRILQNEFTELDAIAIIRQVAQGIAYFHSKNIIHR